MQMIVYTFLAMRDALKLPGYSFPNGLRHPRESGDPSTRLAPVWIPACAGMTGRFFGRAESILYPFLIILALLFGVAAPAVQAQGVIDRNHVPGTERVDPFERRSDVIDGNNIRATITNWAQTANSGSPGDFLYEWPKNTNRIYIALTQLWVGTEVTDRNGDDLWLVEVSDFRRNPVDENRSWTFEPIRGYVNPAGSALTATQDRAGR